MTNSLSDHFISIATAKHKPAKKSSLIHGWLGFKCSQSTSIRIGYYIEELINRLTPGNIKCVLEDNNTIVYNNQVHQIDHLIQDNDGTIWHLEAKSNTDLDRGKKRDIAQREQQITEALTKLIGQPVESCILCPFIEDSKETSGLGHIMGMKEFISKFNPNFTLSEFNQLGKNPAIHSVL